nr:response regulator transcription factor [Microbispora rosea]
MVLCKATFTEGVSQPQHGTREKEELIQNLRRRGSEADGVDTGGAALQVYENADLVIIDLDLPDLDGLEVCRRIRSACDIPIIVTASQRSELDCVLAFQAGADDYVSRPYGCRELMARMDAVMRRAKPKPIHTKIISHGPLQIDVNSREVRLDGRRIDLTRKEFDLLHLLASHPNTVVSRKLLMRQIWKDSWSRRSVDTHVSSLRNKLGSSRWIITVRGVGFRLGSG